MAVVMVDEGGPVLSTFSQKVIRLLRDPDFMLDATFSRWDETKNPYYAWEAINRCTTHKKQLPTWVVDYLSACAERMMSDKAQQSNDLRKILPWILAFPAKRGPGKLLNPDHDPDDKMIFALRFAIEIENGKKPSIARSEAAKYLPRHRGDRIDDKTLQRWLKEYFHLARTPRTITEWKLAMRAHYDDFYTLVTTRFREIPP
jgi:hypothetical protein